MGAGRVFGAMVFAVISSLTSGAVSAQAVPTGEITEYGLYTIVNGKPALEEKTTRVPARKGVRFGFCADLAGLADIDGKAMLSELVRHPVLTQPNGVETNGWNAPHMVSVMNGRGHWCGGHELRNDWQLVPGKWRFVVTDGVRDIVVQEFDVVADER